LIAVVAKIKTNIISELNLKVQLPVESSSIVAVAAVVAVVEFVDFFLELTSEELFYIISIEVKLSRKKW
jgi:hypothetical protein